MAQQTKTATKPSAQEMQPLPPTVDNLPAPRSRANSVQAIVPASWQEVTAIASAIARARMAPKSYCDQQGNPISEKIAIGIMHGMEVGLTPMAALQSIAVINGMPSLWGDGLMAVVRHSGLLEDLQEGLEVDPKTKAPLIAWCKAKRRGEASWKERSLTWPEVVRAGWDKKPGPWQQTPGRMMPVRVRGWLMRDMFADVLRGLHSAEEEQDMVDVTQRSSASFAPEPQSADYTDPKNQASATPASPGASADPVGDTSTPTSSHGEPEVAGGTAVTDVADQNEHADIPDEIPDKEPDPLVFEKYKTYGELIDFSLPWLEQPGRTAAQATAWHSFYSRQIEYGMSPKYGNPRVKESLADLLSVYGKVIAEPRE